MPAYMHALRVQTPSPAQSCIPGGHPGFFWHGLHVALGQSQPPPMNSPVQTHVAGQHGFGGVNPPLDPPDDGLPRPLDEPPSIVSALRLT